MRVIFETPSTGVAYFPGLAKPTVIDMDQLSPADAEQLRQLVEKARFFDLPARVETSSARGAPDAQEYTVTIEQGDKRHTLSVAEPLGDLADAHLKELISFIRDRAQALRRGAGSSSAP